MFVQTRGFRVQGKFQTQMLWQCIERFEVKRIHSSLKVEGLGGGGGMSAFMKYLIICASVSVSDPFYIYTGWFF